MLNHKSNLQWYLGISEQPGREKVKIKKSQEPEKSCDKFTLAHRTLL